MIYGVNEEKAVINNMKQLPLDTVVCQCGKCIACYNRRPQYNGDYESAILARQENEQEL